MYVSVKNEILSTIPTSLLAPVVIVCVGGYYSLVVSKVLVTMMTEGQTRSVSVSVTSSDYYNISLTANSVCSANLLTTSVTTDSEPYSHACLDCAL